MPSRSSLPVLTPTAESDRAGIVGDHLDPRIASAVQVVAQEAPGEPRPGPHLFALLKLCRPRQWAKNVFLLMPLFFSLSHGSLGAVLATAMAFACFCLWTSAVYCVNDVLDAPADRTHPRKRNRPIAAGQVASSLALGFAFVLVTLAALISTTFLPVAFLGLGGLYLLNSLAYCLLLKRRVIVDVLSIAIGFVLRLLAGCAAIGVQPSSWIIVCGFSLALLLGYGKRRLELDAVERPTDYRPTLDSYTVDKLNLLLSVTAALCLLSYALYTVSPQTILLHRTENLLFTVPFVAYGVFRYLFKVQEGQHDGPVEVLLKDRIFMVNGLLWLTSVVFVLYVLPLTGFQP
jgi:4-hydroxybenzoate polyprenyltransferase